MTEQIYGGRVLAGEDSEEDDEEEELGFQLQGFSTSSAALSAGSVQPKFSITVPTPAIAIGEDEESENDDDEKENENEKREIKDATVEKVTEQKTGDAFVQQDCVTPSTKRRASTDRNEAWTVDPSIDGIAMMSNAVVNKLGPSIDTTLRRICELTENQERLLQLLATQHAEVRDNKQLAQIDATMSKLPLYFRKVQDIKAAMIDITASVDKMKNRAEYLRVEAQSHAIKKENKRESLSQWNKMFAAKSGDTITTGNASCTTDEHERKV